MLTTSINLLERVSRQEDRDAWERLAADESFDAIKAELEVAIGADCADVQDPALHGRGLIANEPVSTVRETWGATEEPSEFLGFGAR